MATFPKIHKSILIIETPETCGDCPCYDAVFGMCEAAHEKINYDIRADWCPMKDVKIGLDYSGCSEEE